MPPKIITLADSLYWSYANLAMAHSALQAGHESYRQFHFIVRSRLYSGLQKGTMNIGTFLDDERLKMMLPQACCYCGVRNNLSIDHLMPKVRGGTDQAENLVWACRTCNSSKGDKDLMIWYQSKNLFPPILLLRRYLKIAIHHCTANNVMLHPLEEYIDLPFVLVTIPHSYPQPSNLMLWVVPLG